ncbi:HlyD family efflux transporter periplasmic adaptor subunit [Massilia sp. R2A-15]|uniref:HlyD family secretion protein n=1 Tax=Massilia sp. R2A-15 TaxID=3064278 RepID=UPI0027365664|nr:HlyD family efflux transporter periplasmic adaptor subunit [Massilia sp. R2A-15]WLI90158.1 HlyD family efflux transporter periplasmic adaptor subunit [Massilia sp. R2A-15]
MKIAAGFGAAVVVGVAMLLAFGEYTSKVRVTGLLAPAGGAIKVVAGQFGRISARHVREGDAVKAGQLLFELSAERVGAGGSIDDRVETQLTERRTQAALRRAATRDQLAQQTAALGRQRLLAEAELANHQGAIAIQDTLVRSARTTYARYAKLARQGFVAQALLAQYANARDVELAKRTALAINLQNARRALEQIKGELAALAGQSRVSEADARASLAALAQETAEHDGRRATTVLAPAAGHVTTFAYSVGQTVPAGTVLATVLPAGAALEAQLLVPSHAKAAIKRGQRVELRIDAFPYQKYGLVPGTVEQIELSPITDLPPGAAPGAMLYRASVTLSANALTMYGQRTAFEPGMTLQADIFNDRRRLIEWVFDPLVSAAKGRAP